MRSPLALLAGGALALTCAELPGVARAEARAPGRSVFALIVTNNRSTRLGRADLRYADDDGAKYYETFRGLAPEDHLALLTQFDADTARLFPDLEPKTAPPDRSHVLAAAARIAEGARAAAQAGDDVEFYFVFAGHGDVDEGRGFLELADGPFQSGDLTALLKTVPATREHVILDSCDSFFVLNPRKPGGRHFATPEDAARTLSETLPNVGVFLSTSADAEVFEWSELQSGIFSYAVRSGLSGAADADGDGRVSYAELRAFVAIAASQVRNPTYRPQVFARGPGGHDEGALLDLRGDSRRRVSIDPASDVRVTVRDADEVPWIDVHKEAGASLTLRVPERWASRATLEERAASAPAGEPSRRRPLDPQSASGATLAQLTPPAPRGSDEIFRSLFASPFGPRAFAQFEAERQREPAPVYGVSADDRERMRLLLEQVSNIEFGSRMVGGIAAIPSGAAVLGIGALMLKNDVFPDPTASHAFAYTTMAVGGVTVAMGALTLALPSAGERLYKGFLARMQAGNEDPARVLAETETKLFEIADDYHANRILLRWLAVGFAVFDGTSSALLARGGSDAWEFELALTAGLSPLLFGLSFIPYPVERMADLWKNDPSLQRVPRVTVKPVFTGTGIGVVGTF